MTKQIRTIAGNFSENRYRKFKAAYQEAISAQKERFEFEGHPFLTRFASYLVQHLDGHFK